MDNFLDRIAQRLNSQDVIKANAAAEESEMKKLRLKVSEYEKILQEMRQVNLHNAELVRSTQNTLSKINEAAEKISQLEDSISLAAIDENAASTSTNAAIGQLKAELTELITSSGMSSLEKSTERLVEMGSEISMWLQQSQSRSEETVQRVQQAGEMTTNIFGEVSTILEKNSETVSQLSAAGARISSATDKLSALLEKDRFDIEKLSKKFDIKFDTLDVRVSEMSQAIETGSNSQSLINEIKQTLDAGIQNAVSARQEFSSRIEDFIHKEDVKVYRNVQAVIEDGAKAHEESCKTANNALRSEVKSMKLYLLMAILFSIVSAGVGIAQLIGLF